MNCTEEERNDRKMKKDSADVKKAQKILDYWYTMEFLAQDKYDAMWDIRSKMKKAEADYRNGRLKDKTLWDYLELQKPGNIYSAVASEAAGCGMKKWGNITVYIGKIKRESCIECIAEALPAKEEGERHERSFDEIAWASLQLAPDGTYVDHSLSLSTVIWAMEQIRNSRGKLSERIDEKQYSQTVEELERRFFGKEELPGNQEEYISGYEDEEERQDDGRIQKFSPDAVTEDTLCRLFQAIEREYVRNNIKTKAAGVEGENGAYEEIYGLYFQLFADEQTRKNREDDNYLGLSHAYFLSDIRHVADQLKSGALSAEEGQEALLNYINVLGGEDEKQTERFDLVNPKQKDRREFLAQISEILEVKNAPLGKWPSRYMPAFMQQIAVNLCTGLGRSKLFEVNGRIFSVNGPPGTGKTTLLKEIVVSNIIERAILLAEYENPDDAFDRHVFHHGEGEGGSYYKYVRAWYSLKNDRINDYGILVASCNNAAVENVTKELPLGSGIQDSLKPVPEDSEEYKEMLAKRSGLFDPEQSGQEEILDKSPRKDIYFTEYARQLLGDDDAWGLAAAALGKKSNISDFYYKVLWPLHRDFYLRNSYIEARLEKYRAAREDFGKQLEKVRGMQEEMQRVCSLARERNDGIRKYDILQEEIERKKRKWDEASGRFESRRKESEEALQGLERELGAVREAEKTISGNLRNKEHELEEKEIEKRTWMEKETEVRDSVGLLDRLFFKANRESKDRLAEEYRSQAEKARRECEWIAHEIETIQMQLTASGAKSDRIEERKRRIENERKEAKEELLGFRKQLSRMEEQAEESRRTLQAVELRYMSAVSGLKQEGSADAGVVLDESFVDALLSGDDEVSAKAQVADPWFTDRYNVEREKLFSCAMRLNKEFVLSSKHCRDNFITLAQYWGLKPDENNERIAFHKEDREAFAPALYQTLFLLVPVLSSTFASIGSFMKDIKKKGALGTLVVDEAGQAQPQMAVGALYRCRKAMIVGDPKQVEPVVTDDLALLKKAFDDEELKPYKSKNISVQSFADGLNAFGTYLDNGTDYPEWVGCPLLVHRRCISPMYDISNEISYNGIMKQQTRKPGRKKEKNFVYERSQWINVDGKERGNKDHFVEAQGERACEILEKAFSKAASPRLFVISPFTTVVRGMKKYIRDYKAAHPESSLSSCDAAWMNTHIGTVHTFQGKEADEVIFLLGCDSSKGAAGAIKWVNANIVNVAATRAKYRLYVIGDERAWRHSEVVSRAKIIIDTFAISQIKRTLEQKIPQEEKQAALADVSRALPPVTAFHMDEVENEDGGREYSVSTEGLLQALGPEFVDTELSEEQLREFGFSSYADLQKLPGQIRDNLQMGIRLYHLLMPVYEVNENLDASCCSILFCKALELRMQECFRENLKRLFPDQKIRGQGKGRGMVALKEAREEEFTLGTFEYIIHGKCEKLGGKMAEMGKKEYNERWWLCFENRLKNCKNRRNQCCHSGLFTWADQGVLLREMFRKEQEGGEKEGKREKIENSESRAQMPGLMFAAEAGKML